MSRTDHSKTYSTYNHEGRVARKMTRRLARTKASQLMQKGKHDIAAFRTTKGTEGWITW